MVILTLLLVALFAPSNALAQQNVFTPGDPIILVNGVNDGDGNAGPPPGAEGVEHAIDRNTQKYLNFLDLGSGFIATPSIGVTIVNSIRFYTANDAEERDPASYLLEGSSSGPGGPWTIISSNALALPSGRNPGGVALNPATQFIQTLAFNNTAAYASYRVTFPTLKNAGAANSMQIGEVELLGAVPQIQTLTLITLTNTPWAYNDATATPGLHGSGWELPNYDTNSAPGWKTGLALFGNDGAGIYDAANQPFRGGVNGFATPLDRLINGAAARVTFYFRTKFTLAGSTAGVSLTSSNWIDDGIIVYLNGVEATRLRMPAGAATWDTLGSNPGTEGAVDVLQWNASGLVQGENTVAVELHQSGPGSSDVAFALTLLAQLPLAPIILTPNQPTNRVVFANRSTTLSVNAIGSPTPTYQWYFNNNAIDPAVNPSATSASYVIANMAPADAGNYYVIVSNVVGTAQSRTATVDYLNDTNPPVLVEAVGSATFDRVNVLFDGRLDGTSGSDAFNYMLNNGLTVSSVVLSPDGNAATLILDAATPLLENTLYTLTVNNVMDLAGNTILANSMIQFRSWSVNVCSGGSLETYPLPGGGVAVSQLTSSPLFPNSPDFRGRISSFDIRVALDPANPSFYSTDARENYGGRLSGFFIAPETGPHTFFFASDDNGELWLSTDDKPSHKSMIARESVWSNTKQWTASGGGSVLGVGGKRSAPINLQAGHAYYIEALYHEGGGGDNAAVAVQLPSQASPPAEGADALPPTMLGSASPIGLFGNITVSQQPASQTKLENTTAIFTVGVNSPVIENYTVPICYQWYRDGTEIAGATGPTFSIGPVTLADSGSQFSVRVAIIGSSATSSNALLTVVTDTNPPAAIRAVGSRSMTNITVSFSELMEATSAQDSFNYTVAGFTVDSAVLDATGTNVLLSLGGTQTPGVTNQVCIQNLKDLAGNTINPNPVCLNFRTFVLSSGVAVQELYFNIGGGVVVSDLQNASIYPNSPSLTRFKPSIEANTADEFDNYGTRFSGFIIPPVSGNYNFFMSSDDGGALYLSTDASPGNLALIASEPVWNARRDWTGTTRWDPLESTCRHASLSIL